MAAKKKTPPKAKRTRLPPKKSVKTAVTKTSSTRSAVSTVKRVTKPRVPKIVPQPEWRITLVFGNNTGVYGLATDQRIYRWNTRSALWVLHKEGLSSTQQ